ncbi:MAG: hypothetical protein HY073_03080 [Deltaproteobacteria bacterium]|nr:hypothetical protein [Deltaproteobacteria bacterium]
MTILSATGFPMTLPPSVGGEGTLVRLPVLQGGTPGGIVAPNAGEQLAKVVKLRVGQQRPDAPSGRGVAIPAGGGDPQLLSGAHVLFLADSPDMIDVVRSLLEGAGIALVATTEVAEADRYLKGESLPDIFIACYRAWASQKRHDDPDGVTLLNHTIRRREQSPLSLLLWEEDGDELARHFDLTHQVGPQTPFTHQLLSIHTGFAEHLLGNLTDLMGRKELARSWTESLHFTRDEKKEEDKLLLKIRQYIALRRAIHLLWATITEPALTVYLGTLTDAEIRLREGIERCFPKIGAALVKDTASFQDLVRMDKTQWHNYKGGALNKSFLAAHNLMNLLIRNAPFEKVTEDVRRFVQLFDKLVDEVEAIFQQQEMMSNMPLKDCDVRKELEGVVRAQGFDKERCQIDVPEDLKMTLPEGMLVTIVEQFKMNADHFTPEGAPPPQFMASVLPAHAMPYFEGKKEGVSHYLFLHVINSCQGTLDHRVADGMFNVGQTTRVNGTGYGLILIRRLLDRVGGTYTVRSSEESTAVGVFLPIPEPTDKLGSEAIFP